MVSSPVPRLSHLCAVIVLFTAMMSTSAIATTAQGGGGGGPEERGPEAAEGSYEVAVDCRYDAEADRTTCTFRGVAGPGAKDVSHVDVPEAAVCAEVVGGDYEYVSPDPNTGVTGFKSKGSRGVLTLVLAGEVIVEGTATYAIKSGDGVFRVEGPGLACDVADEAGDVEAERTILRVATFHCPAEGKSRTTYEVVESVTDDDADVAVDLDPIEVDVLEDAECVRAAAVGFAVTDAGGEVVVEAATDGLGEAEAALVPGTYTLHENVLESSTDVTLTDGGLLTVAIVILGAVPLDVAVETEAEAPVVDVAPDTEAMPEDVETQPEAEESIPAEDADAPDDVEVEAEEADDTVETETEEQLPAEETDEVADTQAEEGALGDETAEAEDTDTQVEAEDVEADEQTAVDDSDPVAEPGDVTDGTGAIVVHKLACDVAEAAPEVDWEAACDLSSGGVDFRLTPVEGTSTLPPSIGRTEDGSLSFDHLPPGRYQLEEVGSRWCRAQSDGVDAESRVVVEAGQRSTVWVYNCTGSA